MKNFMKVPMLSGLPALLALVYVGARAPVSIGRRAVMIRRPGTSTAKPSANYSPQAKEVEAATGKRARV